MIGRILRFASLAALCAVVAPAALPQTVSVDLGTGQGLTSGIVQLIAAITVLSLAPSILVMTTSFVRIVVVLSLLRTAIGLQNAPPNSVVISLSLFLTAFVMAPTFDAVWREGVQPMMDGTITEEEGMIRAAEPIKAFMEQHVRDKDLELFIDMANEEPANTDDQATILTDPEPDAALEAGISLRTLIPAYMLSELRRAFEIGFLLFLPFLIIDLVIAAILTSMGMMMLPPLVVSLPFKLIFFVLVDGWWLVAGSLVRSYAT